MKSTSVNISFARQQMRFDSSFHLSDGLEVRRMMKKSPYELETIRNVTKDIYCPGIFRRNYTKTGYAFLGGGDIQKADYDSGKYLKKARTPNWEILEVKKGWTLVTCGGTIGDTVFTNNLLAKCWVSQHVMRVIPNDSIKEGMLYAYLATKYGKLLLTTGTYGSVIPTISAENIAVLPIPNFPDSFQKEVDDLIQQAAKHREQAAKALDEAHAIIDNEFSIAAKPKDNIVSVQNIIKSHTTRFEGSYYTSPNRSIYDFVINNFKYKPLKDCSERIFRPGIFKREYVSRGVTFLGGADIMMAIPKSDKKLSMKQVSRMPELQVQKGWILVTCGGTIGNTVYVDNQIAKCVVSQHVMRVVPKEEMLNGYLYAFLSSKIGYELITLFTYGSVIPSVEAHHLEKVPVPILDDEKTKHIDELVQSYVENLELSKLKETLAITMVEEEIEKWQSPTA